MKQSKVEAATLDLSQLPTEHLQARAAAWLREAGEHRPALRILQGDAPLCAELRYELARWIAAGCKRKRGAVVPRNPHNALPPSWAERAGWATPKMQRAHVAWLAWPALHFAATIRDPVAARAARVRYVAKRVGVALRTAQKWAAIFENAAP